MNKLRKYPKRFFWGVYLLALVLSLILHPLLLRSHELHHHYSFQYLPEFFALFGLVVCMLMILIAKGIGIFISTDENYYEKRSEK
jgi:hypothetical protein